MSNSINSPVDAEELLKQVEADVAAENSDRSRPTCAKCGTFEDWGSASWCPICGYYPEFHEEPEAIDRSLQSIDPDSGVVYEHWYDVIPGWGKVMLAGMGLITFVSILVRVYFEYRGGNRATWAFYQLLIGAAFAITAHFRAAFVGLNRDQKLSPGDVFTAPFATWDRTIKALPASRKTVWMLAWGLTAVITAMTIVGGLRYSAIFDTWQFTAAEPEDEAIYAKTSGLRDSSTSADDIPLILPPPPEGPYVEAVIYGYFPNTNPRLVFDQLLFACSREGEAYQICQLGFNEIPKQKRRAIAVILHERRTREPLFETTYNATWVEPSVICKIQYSELNDQGEIVDPVFVKKERDLRKERGFLALRKRGDYGPLIRRLDIDGFEKEHEKRMANWTAKCDQLRAKHQKLKAKRRPGTKAINIRNQGKKARRTFENVSDAMR